MRCCNALPIDWPVTCSITIPSSTKLVFEYW
jgi:hypothetical protein